MNEVYSAISLQVCLNQDVLVHLLYFIDDKHLIPIVLTCKLFQDAVTFSNRQCNKQSLSCYCYRVETLKWVLGVIAPIASWHWKTIIKASCAYGSIEAMQWLQCQNPQCPLDEEACTIAAEHGKLEVLKWLRSQNPPCPWNALTCTTAAGKGHLKVLKWLRSQDPPCPWNHHTCSIAAENGHLEVLKWLRTTKPRCPWTVEVCDLAAYNCHLHVLRWLTNCKHDRSQRIPCDWDIFGPMWDLVRVEIDSGFKMIS